MSEENTTTEDKRSDTIADIQQEIGVDKPVLTRTYEGLKSGQPKPSKRQRLSVDKQGVPNQARKTSDGYITPGNTSETMSSASMSSGTNSVSSSSSGLGEASKASEESDDIEVRNVPEGRPNREFLRHEPPTSVSHHHHHHHHRQPYHPTVIQFPAAAPLQEYRASSQAAMTPPVTRMMSIEPTQLPLATVAVPIPASNLPAMPQFQPLIHPPILVPGPAPTSAPISPHEAAPQLPGSESKGSAAMNGANGAAGAAGAAPAACATAPVHLNQQLMQQQRLPPPQQVVQTFDPAYSLAFHYHFYPPGVSFYPVGIPTGIPGILFPGTLNHGLYQTPSQSGARLDYSKRQVSHHLPSGLPPSESHVVASGPSILPSSLNSPIAPSSSSSAGPAYPPTASATALVGGIAPLPTTPVVAPIPPVGLTVPPEPAKSESQSNSPLAKRQYPCPYDGCEWSFSRASDQRRHIKSHEKPLLQCPFWTPRKSCHRNSGAFNRLDVLKRHLRLVHFEPYEDRDLSGTTAGRCRHCRLDFDSAKDFVNHCNGCAAQIYSSSGSSGSSDSGPERSSEAESASD